MSFGGALESFVARSFGVQVRPSFSAKPDKSCMFCNESSWEKARRDEGMRVYKCNGKSSLNLFKFHSLISIVSITGQSGCEGGLVCDKCGKFTCKKCLHDIAKQLSVLDNGVPFIMEFLKRR